MRKTHISPKINDIIGQLTILSGPFLENHRTYYYTSCTCGNEQYTRKDSLTSGSTKTCGCGTITANTKHGLSSNKLYKIFNWMYTRCYNKNSENYYLYGGKGIKICDEWLNNFETFYNWAIQNGYTENLSIDRKNNNMDYCPDNCRWSTMEEQQNNRSNNHLIMIFGETKTLSNWAKDKRCKVKYGCFYSRITRGWEPCKALTSSKIK